MNAVLPVGDDPVGPDLETMLRIRVETVRTNLEQVKLAKDFVAGRRSDIADLSSLFEQEGIRAQIREELRIKLTNSLEIANTVRGQSDLQVENVKQLRHNLRQAIESVDRISLQAQSKERIALTMRTRWSAFTKDFYRHIDDSFSVEAGHLIKNIKEIDYSDLEQAWLTYRDEVRDQSDALFSEYVEFLAGLALRDTGLGGLLPSPLPEPTGEAHPTVEADDADEADPADEADEAEFNRDVCLMADDLIRQIYYIGTDYLWHSMAVPGRTVTTARSTSRMIRLGFPDWTVWAVPLAAYQFGLVVVDESGLVDDYPGSSTVHASDLRVVFADAFATFALGPAYAMASILTKLEPTPVTVGDAAAPGRPLPLSDTERVSTILATLRFMDSRSTFEDLVSYLEESWKASMDLNGIASEPAPASVKRVAAWCDYMHKFLKEKGEKISYTAHKWDEAMGWPSLLELTAPGSTAPVPELELRNVRDLLSAAWYQRLQSPEQSREIAIAALGFWRLEIKGPSAVGAVMGRRV